MFGVNKGNTAGNIPLQTTTMTAAAPMAAQPQGIFGRLQNSMGSMAPLTPEEMQRQQMLQALQQQQTQPQFSPTQFGGAANNGGPLAKYLNMLKGGM